MNQTQVKAQLKHLRVAPRKTRLVVDIIRNMRVNEAEANLLSMPNRAAPQILKLLRSAMANAKNNAKLDPTTMYIKEIRVDQGPKLRRWTPRARGGGSRIEKKTSHISITLGVLDGKIEQRFIIQSKKIKKDNKIKAPKKAGKKNEKHGESDTKPVREKHETKKGIIPKLFSRKVI
ncbi:MAG: 50S ribosomal protein L22 [Patescibacteria group bacterium]